MAKATLLARAYLKFKRGITTWFHSSTLMKIHNISGNRFNQIIQFCKQLYGILLF